MQFGSLNSAGGENRLNVAITRARRKVIIITSIWPEELKLQGIKNDGPKLLKGYLEFAKQVSSGNFLPEVKEQKHPANWYLSSKILSWSGREEVPFQLSVSPLPVGDLVFRKSNRETGLVLTDDDAYEQMVTVKDGHVYTPSLMEQKSWPWLRVYSRNWWNNRDMIQQELSRFMYRVSQSEV